MIFLLLGPLDPTFLKTHGALGRVSRRVRNNFHDFLLRNADLPDMVRYWKPVLITRLLRSRRLDAVPPAEHDDPISESHLSPLERWILQGDARWTNKNGCQAKAKGRKGITFRNLCC